MAFGWRRLGALGLAILAILSAPAAWAIEAEPISSGSFTIVLLPDTQNYSTNYPQIFNAQTQWIADHKSTHNIQMVLHQGDVTNNNDVTEFTRARTAMSTLDTAGVPYSIAPGNHDYGPSGNGTTRDSLFNNSTYFGPGSPYASQASIGGFFEAGKTENSYSTFTAGGKDWLVFSVEFGPRDQVVAWMNTVAAAHPDHNFILNTHAYLYDDSTRYDWATKNTSQTWNPHSYTLASLPGGVNDGEELWNKLVKNYENWKFTFNGHVLHDGTGWLGSEGTNGNVVHQILANYQMWSEGGSGYLRIMEFLADGDTVKVSSYSPYLSAYFETPDQRFTFAMSELPPEPEPPAPIRGVSSASVEVVDSGNVWSIVGTGPTAFSLISPANGADVSFAVGIMPLYRAEGVLMATVRQNSRGGNYGTVEVSQENFFPNFDDTILQVATSWAAAGGEHNVNVATAFFSFDDPWRAGHVERNGTLRERANVAASNVTQTATGRYRLTLPDTNSQTDGMLFAIGGENEDNIVAAAPTVDGTAWEVTVRDNKTAKDFATCQNGRWSFVFVDYDAPGLVGGRVAANGSLIHAEGSFSLTHTAGSGAYRLHMIDYTPSDGILLLTLAGLETVDAVTAPADNIISYEASGSDFLINTRDRDDTLSPLEDAAFVFAFLAFDSALFPARLGDANMDGVVDELDASLLAQNWQQATGATWWEGDFNGDGAVDDLDLAVLAANWGAGPGGPAVPEPAAVVLLVGAIVALPLLRREGILRRRLP